MKTVKVKQYIAVKDERLDIDQIDHYRLSFFIGARSCELAIYDERKKRLLQLETFAFDSKKSLVDNLEDLHHEHILISAGFWKRIQVVLRSKQFCQVPNALYSAEHAYDYLKLNGKTDPLTDEYLSTLDESHPYTTVFAMDKALRVWFSAKYPKPEVSLNHQSSVFLSGTLAADDPQLPFQLLVNFTQKEMLLAGLEKGKLVYYNQFALKGAETEAKMIFHGLKQFSKEGQATPILLWGPVDTVKSHQPALTKFFKNLSLGQRPKGLKLHNNFNALEAYEFGDIFWAHASQKA